MKKRVVFFVGLCLIICSSLFPHVQDDPDYLFWLKQYESAKTKRTIGIGIGGGGFVVAGAAVSIVGMVISEHAKGFLSQRNNSTKKLNIQNGCFGQTLNKKET